jgi:hypothetical protein
MRNHHTIRAFRQDNKKLIVRGAFSKRQEPTTLRRRDLPASPRSARPTTTRIAIARANTKQHCLIFFKKKKNVDLVLLPANVESV